MRKIAFGDNPERQKKLWPSIYTKNSCDLREAVRTPFVKNEYSETKMGALIIESVSMEQCVEAGIEISQTVCQEFSYKGQYTFSGDSLIGECCNLVVRNINSNLILNYSTFIIWDFNIKKFINIELQFYGSTMRYHSKY